jgi:hypothetical protein
MRRLLTATCVAFVISAPFDASAQTAKPAMTVFVTAAEVTDVAKIDKDTEKKLRAAIQAANKARRDLEKQLKATHGNKRENWPADAQNQYLDAEEAEAQAIADWEYRRVKQANLADSAEDLKKSIIGEGMSGAKENIKLVENRADAQLIVEVDGRRSSNTAGGFRDNNYWVTVKIMPGPKLAAGTFNAVRDYRYGWSFTGARAVRLARPRDDSPWFRFEVYAEMRYGLAANGASRVLEHFIETNVDALTRPTS